MQFGREFVVYRANIYYNPCVLSAIVKVVA